MRPVLLLPLLIAHSTCFQIWRPCFLKCKRFTSPPRVGSGLPSCASLFEQCQLKGGDIDLDAFARATTTYCELIREWGAFTGPSISQVNLCIAKMERARKRLKRATMRTLLEAEVASGVHKSGGKLADPSAAMGLLWVRRGLAYWVRVFELEAERIKTTLKGRRGSSLSFKEQCKQAYQQASLPERRHSMCFSAALKHPCPCVGAHDALAAQLP